MARTLRTRWWPRFLLVGVLLVIIGATLITGAAAPWVAGSGAVIIFVTASWELSTTPKDSKHEAPLPPRAPGTGGWGGPAR